MRVRSSIAAAGASAVLAFTAACGYHLAGKGDLIPTNIRTVAIPAFDNTTTRYRLTDGLPEAIAREFIARTHYQVIPDAKQADAVLRGAITRYVANPEVYDQATSRASGVQIIVTMQISFTDRATGKVLFSRPSFEAKQRYEISVSSTAYFEESETAVNRLCRDVARDVVSAILENF